MRRYGRAKPRLAAGRKFFGPRTGQVAGALFVRPVATLATSLTVTRMFAAALVGANAVGVGVGPRTLNADVLGEEATADPAVSLEQAVPGGLLPDHRLLPDKKNGDHCTYKWAVDANGDLQRITREPLSPETALPCKAGPFVLDTLRRYDEGLGGSFQKRLPQIVYAEALGATYLDVQNGQVNDDAGYDEKEAYDTGTNRHNRTRLPQHIWDKHHDDDYSRFLGMGPTPDCDYCSLEYWTNSANPTHLQAIDYRADLYDGATEKYRYQPLKITADLKAICQAMERGTELPVATDPTLAAFSGPDRERLVLRVKGQSAFTTTWYYTPCAVNAHFVERFHAARRERALGPNRPEDELWFAVHLRWGDIGDGDPNEMADDKSRWANKAANLGLLVQNARKVLDLLRERSKRKLVVHFFSEIDADGVKSFTDAIPNTLLHVDTPVTETLDLWSQCEVSLGRSTSGFFALAAHLSLKGIVLDVNGIPLMQSHTHPLVAVQDSFSEEEFRAAAALVIDPDPAVPGFSGSSFGWAPKPSPSPSLSPLPLSSPSPAPQSWAFYPGECPAGQRRAAHSECLAAVTEAARSAGVEVRGRKNVDDGAAVSVPHGCSYSTVSKMAIFNVNPLGTRGEAYQYVCTAKSKSNALLHPKSAATSHATAAAQPTSDLERYSPIHQPRDTRGEDAGLAGRQGVA